MNKQLNTLLNRVDTRLAACAAAAGTSLAVVPSSDAFIVYSGPVSINIPVNIDGVYLNVVTGLTGTSGGTTAGWDINPFSGTGLSFFAPANVSHGSIINLAGGSSATLVDNLPLLTLINGTFTFGTNNGVETTGATAWTLNSSNNYVGFRFQNEALGNQVQFGWAQISLGATLTAPRSIVGYAYKNTGTAIPAGAVPEPSTFGLLGLAALGAVGLRAWRGRKAA